MLLFPPSQDILKHSRLILQAKKKKKSPTQRQINFIGDYPSLWAPESLPSRITALQIRLRRKQKKEVMLMNQQNLPVLVPSGKTNRCLRVKEIGREG